MNDFWQLSLTIATAIGCIANAVLAYKTFHRYRRSWGARLLVLGFILLAFSMCIFSYIILARVNDWHPTEIRQWISVGAFSLFALSVLGWTISLIDFKRHL